MGDPSAHFSKKIWHRACPWVAGFLFLSLVACSPLPLENQPPREVGLLPLNGLPASLEDDLDWDSLILALERNLAYLRRLDLGTPFSYGPHRFTAMEVAATQEAFLALVRQRPGAPALRRAMEAGFVAYGLPETPCRGTGLLLTGYYEPLYEAGLTPNQTFRYPLYERPQDLVTVALSDFPEAKGTGVLTGRVQEGRLVPYYSRQQIEEGGVLSGRGLEIAWLRDPMDVVFLHIQGSGRLRLPDGRILEVGFAAKNGRPYRSIGRYVVDKGYLPLDAVSMQGLRAFVAEHPETLPEILNHNPSYVFFKETRGGPFGNLGIPLTPGRSLAVDQAVFPGAGLAFLTCRKPRIDPSGRIQAWVPFSRFVLSQDTGGAIKGPGRADLFCGSGPYAEAMAGHLREEGSLVFLMKRP